MSKALTLKDWMTWGQCELEQAHFEPAEAKRESQIYLAHVLQRDLSYLYIYPEKVVENEQANRFQTLIFQRKKGTPLAYLLEYQPFWTLDLKVSPATLIPRPETELIVETIIEQFDERPLSVIDLGTGTGAIALSVASERPSWSVVALDNSLSALQIARENREKYQLDNVSLIASHWLNSFSDDVFDIIAANPPYIAANDPEIAGDVKAFEPHEALFSESNGLQDIRTIVTQSHRVLKAGGMLLIEHGHLQQEAVQSLFLMAQFNRVKTLRDLSGKPRVTVGFAEKRKS